METLRCPHCGGKVAALPGSGSRRWKCPHCRGTALQEREDGMVTVKAVGVASAAPPRVPALPPPTPPPQSAEQDDWERTRRKAIKGVLGVAALGVSVLSIWAIGSCRARQWMWGRRLGQLPVVLEWFERHGVRPHISFSPDDATPGILRGRSLYQVNLFADATRPETATLFYDKDRNVRAVVLFLMPPKGKRQVRISQEQLVEAGNGAVWVCDEFLYYTTNMSIIVFAHESWDTPSFRTVRRRWTRLPKDDGKPRIINYYRRHRGFVVEIMLSTLETETEGARPNGYICGSVIIRDGSW